MCQFCEKYEKAKNYKDETLVNADKTKYVVKVSLETFMYMDKYLRGFKPFGTYEPIFCPLCGKRLEEGGNSNG